MFNKIRKLVTSPLELIKQLLFGKIVGGQLRTWLAVLSGWLVNQKALTVSESATFTELLIKVLPELSLGIIAALSSTIQKVHENKKPTEVKVEEKK